MLLAGSGVLWGQTTAFGFIGGTNLTRDFPLRRTFFSDPSYPGGLFANDLYSDTKSLIAGLTFEMAIARRFSLEANAVHRNLRLRVREMSPGGPWQDGGGTLIGTWEWPVLLKYRLPLGAMQPFVEAGPSFRTRKNPAPGEPSQFGTTVGIGGEFRIGRLRVSPTVRYTRWAYDGPFPRIATRPDQIELLTGIGYATSPDSWRVGGRRIRIGLGLGVPLTGGLEHGPAAAPFVSEEQGYAAGLSVGFEVSRRLSVEVGGFYRPYRAHAMSYGVDGLVFSSELTVVTWQFPVLARWNLRPSNRVQPIVEGGPSFRRAGNLNGYHPSSVGMTIGAGVETGVGKMRIGPVVRYTRWAVDPNTPRACLYSGACTPGDPFYARSATRRDQVEVLVNFTF